jgi:two-component system sensor histidine kinase HydH
VARIDLDARAADFLTADARHNVAVSLVGGMVLVGLTLTALWAMRRTAQLEQQRMKMQHLAHLGELAAVLAHEIRNPLGTVKGFLQRAGERAPAQTRALLEPALEETGRLERLVNDLLVYGREPVVRRAKVQWGEIAARLKCDARVVVEESELGLETDAALLVQALLNLVRNGLEASGEGEVRVEARREAGGVWISVLDRGPGVAEEARGRMFEAFYTTKSLGTGLGLAITKKLVEALGGRVEIRGREGGGTEARMVLGRKDS